MNTVFNIGLHHFLFVSIILVGAGVATMLTKRNAIGILIGVELVLNAAAINFVAFNRYTYAERDVTQQVTAAMQENLEALRLKYEDADEGALWLKAVQKSNPDAVAVRVPTLTVSAEPIAMAMVVTVRERAIDGLMFAVFIVVLAAAEAAVALAIFLNYYNNFSSIDVEKAAALKS